MPCPLPTRAHPNSLEAACAAVQHPTGCNALCGRPLPPLTSITLTRSKLWSGMRVFSPAPCTNRSRSGAAPGGRRRARCRCRYVPTASMCGDRSMPAQGAGRARSWKGGPAGAAAACGPDGRMEALCQWHGAAKGKAVWQHPCAQAKALHAAPGCAGKSPAAGSGCRAAACVHAPPPPRPTCTGKRCHAVAPAHPAGHVRPALHALPPLTRDFCLWECLQQRQAGQARGGADVQNIAHRPRTALRHQLLHAPAVAAAQVVIALRGGAGRSVCMSGHAWDARGRHAAPAG